MASVNAHGVSLPGVSGDRVDGYAKAGKKIGGNLSSLENQLIKAYQKGADQGTIQALQIKYQAAQRLYESFMTIMKNAHETMMNVIRMMAVRG